MNDGIAWIARDGISWLGYCVTLARGVDPEELVSRLAGDADPVPLGQYTRDDLETYLAERDRGQSTCDDIAVRYGRSGDLVFAVADGHWPGEMGPGYTDGLSKNGAHVFQLYYEAENPKVPPPDFIYLHDERTVCAFDMTFTWSSEIVGSSPELVQDEVLAAGLPGETNRDVAHARSLAVVERRFRLTLPREQVLYGTLPAALINGQEPR